MCECVEILEDRAAVVVDCGGTALCATGAVEVVACIKMPFVCLVDYKSLLSPVVTDNKTFQISTRTYGYLIAPL
jgi:hypothetical protein